MLKLLLTEFVSRDDQTQTIKPII